MLQAGPRLLPLHTVLGDALLLADEKVPLRLIRLGPEVSLLLISVPHDASLYPLQLPPLMKAALPPPSPLPVLAVAGSCWLADRTDPLAAQVGLKVADPVVLGPSPALTDCRDPSMRVGGVGAALLLPLLLLVLPEEVLTMVKWAAGCLLLMVEKLRCTPGVGA